MSYSGLGWTGTMNVGIPGMPSQPIALEVPIEDMTRAAGTQAIQMIETYSPGLIKMYMPAILDTVRPELDRSAEKARNIAFTTTAILIAGMFGAIWYYKKRT